MKKLPVLLLFAVLLYPQLPYHPGRPYHAEALARTLDTSQLSIPVYPLIWSALHLLRKSLGDSFTSTVRR